MKKVLDNHFFPISRSIEKCLDEVYVCYEIVPEFMQIVEIDNLKDYSIRLFNVSFEDELIALITVVVDEFRAENIINVKYFK